MAAWHQAGNKLRAINISSYHAAAAAGVAAAASRMLLLIYPRGMRAKMAAKRERDAHYLYDRYNRTFPQFIEVEKVGWNQVST